MRTAVFNYPNFGTPNNYPDYSNHSGQRVVILADLGIDPELEHPERLYGIEASDGWKGIAWESELSEFQDSD